MFYHNLTFSNNGCHLTSQVNGVNLAIDEEVLSEILRLPAEGTRSLRNKKGSKKFLNICDKLDDMNIKNMSKKDLKEEYQLLFELVNKVILPRSEKTTTVIGLDLFLTNILAKFYKVNLPEVIIEHMNTVMLAKNRKHVLAYGFWLNMVFS